MRKLHVFVVVIVATAALVNANDLKKINAKHENKSTSENVLAEKQQNQNFANGLTSKEQKENVSHTGTEKSYIDAVALRLNEETTILAIPKGRKLYDGVTEIKQQGVVNEFTGKLLAEEDGAIVTEIQQKFLLTEPTTQKQIDVKKQMLKKRIKKSSNLLSYQRNDIVNSTTIKYLQKNETKAEKILKNSSNEMDTKNIAKHFAVLTNAKMKTFRKSKDMNFPTITPIYTTTTRTTQLAINTTSKAHDQLYPASNDTMKTTTHVKTNQTQKNAMPTITTSSLITTTTPSKLELTTFPSKSNFKPISRPRTLSQLQLKINTLDCEINNIPPNTHLWRGNETHELLLPIMVSEI